MITTCGFIGPAREEGNAHIEDALNWKEHVGGYSWLHQSTLKSQSGEKMRTTEANYYQVPDAAKPVILTGGASAYLKLAEGCSKRCAFCSIP